MSPDIIITADVETDVRSTSVLAVDLGQHGAALVDRLHSMSRDRLVDKVGIDKQRLSRPGQMLGKHPLLRRRTGGIA